MQSSLLDEKIMFFHNSPFFSANPGSSDSPQCEYLVAVLVSAGYLWGFLDIWSETQAS